jgi:hypothetical protein
MMLAVKYGQKCLHSVLPSPKRNGTHIFVWVYAHFIKEFAP